MFVDDTDLLVPGTILTEDDLARVGPGDANIGGNLLVTRGTGQRGWFLALDPEERVITDAFALAGVTFFSSFQPDVQVAGNQDPLCSKTGDSRIFIVNTTNANSFMLDLNGAETRFVTASTFVTQPYTEQGTNRDGSGGGGGGPPPPPGGSADELTDQLRQVMEEMKELFPQECKFANYRIDIKTIAADTGVIFIAPVPVCLIEQNWKEF